MNALFLDTVASRVLVLSANTLLEVKQMTSQQITDLAHHCDEQNPDKANSKFIAAQIVRTCCAIALEERGLK